jgi:hypothetical protein
MESRAAGVILRSVPTIENSEIRVELDECWPRTVRLTRLENGASVAGCSVSTRMLREGGPVAGPGSGVDGQTIRFQAPAGVPIRIASVQEPSSRTSRRS